VTSRAGVRLVHVFAPLTALVRFLGLGGDPEKRLLCAAQSVAFVSLLAEKYCRVFELVQCPVTPETSAEDATLVHNVRALGWLLFVLARRQLPRPEVAPHMGLLLCAAYFAITNSPRPICKASSEPYTFKWLCRSSGVPYKDALET
jgi:hypothetical protein